MKRLFMTLVLVAFCCIAFAQRRTTSVRGYYRKDGTHVSSHTRVYHAGSSRSSSANRSSSYHLDSDEDSHEVFESDLKIADVGGTGGYKRFGGHKITPSTLKIDTNGVTMLVAVLRYNDSVVIDICPLTRRISSGEYESYSPLYFRIHKEALKPEHVIELASKYRFELNDDYLHKTEYIGIGKIELPIYLTFRIEALTLK